MPYSQKYVLAYFMSPIEDGVQFHMTDWPLHVTVADVFAVDRLNSNINTKLKNLFSKTKTANTVAMEDSLLGVTPVVLLDKTKELQRLHDDTVSLLNENGAIFNNPEFTGKGFLPHSTIQKSGRVYNGDEIEIDTISLIDMFPGSDWQQRKVLETFKLDV